MLISNRNSSEMEQKKAKHNNIVCRKKRQYTERDEHMHIRYP